MEFIDGSSPERRLPRDLQERLARELWAADTSTVAERLAGGRLARVLAALELGESTVCAHCADEWRAMPAHEAAVRFYWYAADHRDDRELFVPRLRLALASLGLSDLLRDESKEE